MRVLHITPALLCSTNGIAEAVRTGVSELARLGVDVAVAAVANPFRDDLPIDSYQKIILADGVDIPGLRSWQYSHHLRARILAAYSSPPEIIHAHGLWLYPQLLAAQLSQYWRCPLVLSLHGMLEPWALSQSTGNRLKKLAAWHALYRGTVEHASSIIATSDYECTNLRKFGLRNRTDILPIGVNPPDGWVEAQNGLENSNSRCDGSKTALFLSRIHPKKGLLLLVKAVAEVRPAGWRFLIAGPDQGGHLAEVVRAIKSAGVSAFFEIVGPIIGPKKWNLYRQSDLFILPSYSENFGIVVAEALASGTPVITTTATPWQKIEDRQCGWCCAPTLEAMIETLQKATNSDPEELRLMGQNGKNWIQTTFSPTAIAEKTRELYSQLRDP